MSTPVLVANLYWAMEALPNASADLELAVRRGKSPTFRLTYIARRREMPSDHSWNWCKVCNVEITVRRIHGNLVQCPSCFSRFTEVHEGAIANERIRNDPSILYKAYHDQLSACWWEGSLRCVDSPPLPDGSLAYDVTPFELPTRTVTNGTRQLSRRERRLIARRSAGVPGRRGSKPVPKYVPNWKQEPYEPEVWREHAFTERNNSGLARFGSNPRLDERIYRRTTIGVDAHVCELCQCDVRLFVTLYIEREAPQLTEYITRGLQLAVSRFVSVMDQQDQCLCNSTTRCRPLPVHASELPHP